MKRVAGLVVVLLLATVALSACGESKEDKAMKSVCSARSDISKQVDELKSLTLSTVTIDGVQQNLKAIRSDLSKMKDAQGDLKGDRRQQVENANSAFAAQVQSIASSFGKSLSISDAKAQLSTALQQLASAYEKSLAPIDCS